MRTRSQNNIRKLRQLIDGTVRYPLPRALLSESTFIEPTCFSNAVKISEWRNAMQVEFNVLLKNHTWSLVAKGFHQHAGLDYGETYSPVENLLYTHCIVHYILYRLVTKAN